MTTFREKFAEILTLTQFYLFQEHQLKEAVFSDQKTFQYFKKWKMEQKKQPLVSPPVQARPLLKPAFKPALQMPKPSLPLPPIQQEKKETSVKPETKKIETLKSETADLSLELPAIPTADACENMHALFKQTFPLKTIVTEIPDDAESTQKSTLWKYEKAPSPITILSFNEKPNHLAFLHNLSKAIEQLNPAIEVRSALSIEAAEEWESF